MKTIFILLLFSSFGFSQEEIKHEYYWGYPETENYEAIIGATNCYVRSEADYKSTILDSLQLGNTIIVEKATENYLKLKGINVSWVAVSFKNKAGQTQKGFVWKGFLALGFVKNKQFTFLTTLDKIKQKTESENYKVDYYTITAKVLNANNMLLDQKSIEKNITESSYFQNKTISSLGLSNIVDIYRISCSGQACGVPSFYFYFGWTGKKLIELPEKYQVGDANAYYHSEDFIFPSEIGGKPNQILKKVEDATNADKTGNNDTSVFTVEIHSETYIWTGEKAVFLKKSKPKKFTRKES
jgi:hypothetical protein